MIYSKRLLTQQPMFPVNFSKILLQFHLVLLICLIDLHFSRSYFHASLFKTVIPFLTYLWYFSCFPDIRLLNPTWRSPAVLPSNFPGLKYDNAFRKSSMFSLLSTILHFSSPASYLIYIFLFFAISPSSLQVSLSSFPYFFWGTFLGIPIRFIFVLWLHRYASRCKIDILVTSHLFMVFFS